MHHVTASFFTLSVASPNQALTPLDHTEMWSFWLAFTLLTNFAAALHLEVPATAQAEPVCIRDFVGQNQLVVLNLKSSGYQGDGQRLQVTVIDTLGNQFAKKNDVYKDTRISFTTHESTAVDVCFYNIMVREGNHRMSREIELDIESGSSARDWNALQAAEKLKPAEVDLQKVHDMTMKISNELHYLKAREERMRNTNESTNDRVKYFSILVILALVGLEAWQILYLRHYFKVKHII